MFANAVTEVVLAVLWARVLPRYAAAVDSSTLPKASLRVVRAPPTVHVRTCSISGGT